MTTEALAEYSTIQDAAVRSGFSETAIRNRIRAGQIPTVKPGPLCVLVHQPTVVRLAALAHFGGRERIA